MTTQLLITFSVVSHGDASRVTRLLESLQKHEPNTTQFQILLTDNLGDDLPEFDSAPWASLQILRNPRSQGFAYNHNRAFEMAIGEYFAILNPDLVFIQPVFEQLLTSLSANHAHLIAPKILDINGTVQDSFRPLPSPTELIRRRIAGHYFDAPMPDQNGYIHPDWIAAMFWLMPLSTYQALHGMDEKYRLYLEDVDFCTRARLQGMNIMVDTNVHVQHDAQRSSRRSVYYLFLHAKSAFQFFTSPVYRQARRIR